MLKKWLFAAVLLGTIAGGLWWQRMPLLSWYFVRSLAQAGEQDRAVWVERVASLDEAAVPGLAELLRRDDARVCANAVLALSGLGKRWGLADERTAALATRLTDNFAEFTTSGREAALEWHVALLRNAPGGATASKPLALAVNKVLVIAGRWPDKGLRTRTLALAEALLDQEMAANVDLCRELAIKGMESSEAEIRARAVRLTLPAALHADKDLVDRAVPLLKDSAPEVRRAAVLALGLAEDSLTIQEMLPLLHDGDAEVRLLCKKALGGRGLQPSHIVLAEMVSDPRPGERLNVLRGLETVDDLDPVIWLMHLSHDASPAVRAAAIRYAAEDPTAANFQERMQQMSREDPSPTVRQLAAFYLATGKR